MNIITNNKVSIIIPVYNTEQYINKCIQSIMNQTYENIEIIVINDGSTDNSLNKILELSEMDNRIIIINSANKGVSNARNLGLEKSTGKYITFIDSDDWIEKEYVEKLVVNLEQTECDLSICYFDNEDNYYNVIEKNKYLIDNKQKMYSELLKNPYLSGFLWNKVFKSEIIKNNNLKFDTDIHINEDLLFVCEYLEYCSKIIVDETVLYHYIIRRNSALNSKFSKKQISKIYALEKIMKFYSKYDKNGYNDLSAEYVFSTLKSKYIIKKYKIKDTEIKEKCNEIISKLYKNVFSNSNLREKFKFIVIKYFPAIYDLFK